MPIIGFETMASRCVIRRQYLKRKTRSKTRSNVRCISVKVHQRYFDALVCDNPTYVNQLLSSPDSDKEFLLNANFDFHDSHLLEYNSHHYLRAKKPLFIAIVSGSIEVICSLLKHGCHVTIRDCIGQNFVHLLISMSFHMACQSKGSKVECRQEVLGASPTESTAHRGEFVLADVFKRVVEILDPGSAAELLHQEDDQFFRPLELACHHGMLYFVHTIMNVEGVYLHRIERVGLNTYRWYDVTDYEVVNVKDNRRHLSPVISLMNMDTVTLRHPPIDKTFNSSVFNCWIRSKLRANHCAVFLWIFIRFLYVSGEKVGIL